LSDVRNNKGGLARAVSGLGASMVDQADIWRAVNLLAKQYGTDAALAAAQRAQELLAVGDVNGFTVWKRILESAAELSRTKPGTGEWMN
jgi:hypothetical protein